MCCSPWGCKESDTTVRLNWTDLKLSNNPLPSMLASQWCPCLYNRTIFIGFIEEHVSSPSWKTLLLLLLLGCVWLFETPQTASRQASMFFTISQSSLKHSYLFSGLMQFINIDILILLSFFLFLYLFSVLCHLNIIIISWIVSHRFFHAPSRNSSCVMIPAPGIFIRCKSPESLENMFHQEIL